MTKRRSFSMIWFIVFLALMVAVAIKTSEASDRYDIEQETDVTQTLGDTIVGGHSSKSYAVGMGSFDVDINQCLASESWGAVVFQRQRLVENPWCMADGLDARGRHGAAAEVRCNTKTLKEIYPDKATCLAAVRYVPDNPQPPADVKEVIEEHEQQRQEQVEEREQWQHQQQQQQYVIDRIAREQRERDDIRQRKLDLLREEFDK